MIGKPIKNLVTWCAYLKMSKLGDIPRYDGAGHILFTTVRQKAKDIEIILLTKSQ